MITLEKHSGTAKVFSRAREGSTEEQADSSEGDTDATDAAEEAEVTRGVYLSAEIGPADSGWHSEPRYRH